MSKLKRGDPIPHSRYYRNFCCRCGEPMRVVESKREDDGLYCRDCDPPHMGVGNPRSTIIESDVRGETGGYA